MAVLPKFAQKLSEIARNFILGTGLLLTRVSKPAAACKVRVGLAIPRHQWQAHESRRDPHKDDA